VFELVLSNDSTEGPEADHAHVTDELVSAWEYEFVQSSWFGYPALIVTQFVHDGAPYVLITAVGPWYAVDWYVTAPVAAILHADPPHSRDGDESDKSPSSL
jgi:hypothetical protein